MLCQSELSEVLAIFLLKSAGNVSGVPSFFESSKMERVQPNRLSKKRRAYRFYSEFPLLEHITGIVLFSEIHLSWRSLTLQTNVKYTDTFRVV